VEVQDEKAAVWGNMRNIYLIS